MRIWRIWYYENHEEKSVYIYADSYNEAIVEARKLDPRYSAGQVVIDV